MGRAAEDMMADETNKNTTQLDQTDQQPDKNKPTPAPSELENDGSTPKADPKTKSTSVEDVIGEQGKPLDE